MVKSNLVVSSVISKVMMTQPTAKWLTATLLLLITNTVNSQTVDMKVDDVVTTPLPVSAWSNTSTQVQVHTTSKPVDTQKKLASQTIEIQVDDVVTTPLPAAVQSNTTTQAPVKTTSKPVDTHKKLVSQIVETQVDDVVTTPLPVTVRSNTTTQVPVHTTSKPVNAEKKLVYADDLENVTRILHDKLYLLNKMNDTIRALTRQVLLQQMYAEERIRSDGDSGIKQVRHISEGTRPYFSPSHAHDSIAAIHDHSNNIRTVGMGEVVAVMNGVEFRTRHNDYRLMMPSTTSSRLHATEEIPFPAVPPEVKGSISNQILEMRKYFKAWKDSDTSERDYRPYFKPVLCYMEGSWFFSEDQVAESFFSDRHFIDAKHWYELEEAIRFLSYSGAKHTAENLPFLPKIIINQTEDGLPIFAQWNYRILCHPIKKDLPLTRLRVVDDLKSRLMVKKKLKDYELWRPARFQLNTYDREEFKDRKDYNWLLEELMREIPGKDNYMSNITDFGYAGITLDPKEQNLINAGFYHRKYSIKRTDAMGHQTRNRGFSDQNLFMALTKQKKVLGMKNMRCGVHRYQCDDVEQKWTYAIPMEIIYLTPLSSWNPYDIEYKKGLIARSVTEGGRNGKVDKPLNGASSTRYFITPSEFFDGDEVSPDPADTIPRDAVHVLDRNGTKRTVRATGTRIIFPKIEGIGKLRQRFPIMPVHGEGSGVWKELEALQDIVLNPKTYSFMYYETPSASTDTGSDYSNVDEGLTLITGMSSHAINAQHFHVVTLTENERSLLGQGELVTVTTSQSNGHTHSLVLAMDAMDSACQIKYVMCGSKEICWDNHPKCLISTEGV